MTQRAAARAILTGGLIAGTLDISYALIFSNLYRGTPPIRLLQSVAGGLLGKDTFDGGVPTAVLGLALHFFIALSAATIFNLASLRLPALTGHRAIAGILSGLCIYGFMNYVVLPLCALHATAPTDPLVVGTGLFVHMFCIGLPIAWFAANAPLASGGRTEHSPRQ